MADPREARVPTASFARMAGVKRPLAIYLENCNEMIEDSRRRLLSGEARKWADAGIPPRHRWRWKTGGTYFDQIYRDHECLFWRHIYFQRLERIKRMAQRATNG